MRIVLENYTYIPSKHSRIRFQLYRYRARRDMTRIFYGDLTKHGESIGLQQQSKFPWTVSGSIMRRILLLGRTRWSRDHFQASRRKQHTNIKAESAWVHEAGLNSGAESVSFGEDDERLSEARGGYMEFLHGSLVTP